MNKVPTLPSLDGKASTIASLVVPFCRMPHPQVVKCFKDAAVFPTIRDMKQREKEETVNGRKIMYDDNTTPRWALLWSHGIKDTGHPKGWTFAHVWGTGKDPDAYTHIANVVMMPEAFATLSDKDGPLCAYLRYHAETIYNWKPKGFPATTKPEGYDDLNWEYLAPYHDPAGFVANRVKKLKSKRVSVMGPLMGLKK